MDIRLKNYSHLLMTKIIAFIIVIICFTGAISSFINIVINQKGRFDIVFEPSYFHSREYIGISGNIIEALSILVEKYKNEELILQGEAISENEITNEENNLYYSFREDSKSYNPQLSNDENYEKFKEVYGDRISELRDKLIRENLKDYYLLIQRLSDYEGLIYYASDGVNVFTNSNKSEKEYFKSFPAYIILNEYEKEVFPGEVGDYNYYYKIKSNLESINQGNVIYISFTEEYLSQEIKKWEDDKTAVINSLYLIGGFLLGLVLSFIYLTLIVGRKFFGDRELSLNMIDRLYTDINICVCLILIIIWFLVLEAVSSYEINVIIPVTAIIATAALVLVLSLIKRFKNSTLIKHSLIYSVFNKIIEFVKGVYDSGSVGVKIVLIVIGYPLLAALTFFMFPITLGAAAWIALKRVREFNLIKEGVVRIKEGDIHHTINVPRDGEFAKLASNINSIADGLKQAVDNELKGERLKTELITNVSHDIRTPLTSIITYIDLLKIETDQPKIKEYIEVLEQKSQRLRTLTDDLFEAAKASSGNIPVNYERIDIVSLMTQGLGEVNDKIEELNLEFKLNYPKDRVYITADGKLLWRAIENLLSNIFKYALMGSRVYIDIISLDNEVGITIKNISAYELNISSDELMERFKRGDESRSSQGSGLGLSISKSLIAVQRGRFNVEIDGDLFKAIIYMPKYKDYIE